ncbi:hypothetical protein GCM10023115_40050 [Pontixanthobacter gangjinensis]|uniref:Uncharacterized protein n=1 Tax=Christiangramia aestuarii TaxID=1028746 RepID=A0A7K1LS73_9FLAO|nr:hypothetical protein [Christiangramia aestuarii]MUP43608.1 hypothetical protein [Christiangramia aestuarii]
MMVSYQDHEYSSEIEQAFLSFPISEKYNDHRVGEAFIRFQENPGNDEAFREIKERMIKDYLDSLDIARKMVAKWFNRNENGGFDMDLVAERGMYNASEIDVEKARNNPRGLALLADAGEELIKNTFVIVNDFKYINKEELVKEKSELIDNVSEVASKLGIFKSKENKTLEDTKEIGEVFGKGYAIKSEAYLFRLKWNEEIASRFYNELWFSKDETNEEKARKFEETQLFELELVGTQPAFADILTTKYTTKSEEELIKIATINATDAAIAELQKKYDVFRLKAPLISIDPPAAKIGLKEGLEKGDTFEVLKPVRHEDGRTTYEKVGVLKVNEDHIWDNTYMAHEGNDSHFEHTTFKTTLLGSSSNIAPGMLIRQID